jgi:hypothetical protein
MTYLNDFRFHRGSQFSSLPAPESATQSSVLDVLETEHYKEFYGEGQTFFFLKRTGSSTIINALASGRKSISPNNYIVPIPDAETDN